MKTSLQIGIALTVAVLLVVGCGGKTSEKESKPETAKEVKTNVQIPQEDPGLSIDESFLTEQAAKKLKLEKTIRAYWDNDQGDHKEIRKLILSRKGEILSTKRNINNSSLFSNAEKDSLIKPLDEESMNLSRELIAFSE